MKGWLTSAATLSFLLIVFVLLTLVATGRPHNVVVFAFDGLQARHLKTYGYAQVTAPNLESFFKESYVFTNTVSPASWTVPSFMSIFTSRYPSEHKLTNKLVEVQTATTTYVRTANMQELAPGIPTLAEILKAQGFVTAAFTGDAGVKGEYGYRAGFDEYYDAVPFGGLTGSVPRALAWLKERDRTKPFFLFVHGYDVHGQHEPEGGYEYTHTPPEYGGPYTGSAKEQGALREVGLARGRVPVSESDVAFWRGIYDEKIARADHEFATFMQGMAEEGLLDSTMVVVVSDHGTEFFEHGRVDHGHTLYGELLDVVFAIRMPEATHRAVPDLVSTIDLMPTVLTQLGVRTNVFLQGSDLSPAFRGAPVAHDVYSETDYRLYTYKRAVTTTDGWKFILTRETNEKELYDLGVDSHEQEDLVTREPQRAYELEQQLLAHLKRVGDSGPWPIGCLAVYADQCQ